MQSSLKFVELLDDAIKADLIHIDIKVPKDGLKEADNLGDTVVGMFKEVLGQARHRLVTLAGQNASARKQARQAPSHDPAPTLSSKMTPK